jgi:phage gp36-like protein
VSSYATPTDFATYGLPAAATANVPAGDIQAAINKASDLADTYLQGQLVLPLTAWGSALTSAVCEIAACDLMTTRGTNPMAPGDGKLEIRKSEAIAWLVKVSENKASLKPPTYVDSRPNIQQTASGPYVMSRPPRGWGGPGRIGGGL